MGLANYALVADLQTYLSGVPLAQQVTWPDLLSDASREIDGYCERYFYSDGASTKYFDVPGETLVGHSTWPQTGDHGLKSLFIRNHDFYSLTALKVTQIENGNPGTDFTALTGDGVTPPSDFYLEPSNQQYIGETGDANHKPFYWIDLPTYGPTTSTSFRGYFTPGKRTVSISATWGWPAIPDQIKRIAIKLAVRMFKAMPSGFTGDTGSPDIPSGAILRYLDANDFITLNRYKKWVAAL